MLVCSPEDCVSGWRPHRFGDCIVLEEGVGFGNPGSVIFRGCFVSVLYFYLYRVFFFFLFPFLVGVYAATCHVVNGSQVNERVLLRGLFSFFFFRDWVKGNSRDGGSGVRPKSLFVEQVRTAGLPSSSCSPLAWTPGCLTPPVSYRTYPRGWSISFARVLSFFFFLSSPL